MKIKILGVGCPNCKKLESNVEKAIKEMGIEARIEKVTKMEEIAEYGVMSLPVMVVDERVLASGKILGVDEIKDLLISKNKSKCDEDGGCHSCHCC